MPIRAVAFCNLRACGKTNGKTHNVGAGDDAHIVPQGLQKTNGKPTTIHPQQGETMHHYKDAKERLRLDEVAARYTGQAARRGKLCCPFHADTNPSMQLKNERYHCFVCEAHGDVIDFTARYFNEGSAAALARLDADFSLGLALSQPLTAQQKRQAAQQKAQREHRKNVTYTLEDWGDDTRRALSLMHRVSLRWRRTYTPRRAAPEEPEPTRPVIFHPRYLFAIRNLDWIKHLIDYIKETQQTSQQLHNNATMKKEIYELGTEFIRLADPRGTDGAAALPKTEAGAAGGK